MRKVPRGGGGGGGQAIFDFAKISEDDLIPGSIRVCDPCIFGPWFRGICIFGKD